MSDEYVHCLDCGDGFTGVDICQTHQTVYFKHVQLIVHQLYFSKAVQKKE